MTDQIFDEEIYKNFKMVFVNKSGQMAKQFATLSNGARRNKLFAANELEVILCADVEIDNAEEINRIMAFLNSGEFPAAEIPALIKLMNDLCGNRGPKIRKSVFNKLQDGLYQPVSEKASALLSPWDLTPSPIKLEMLQLYDEQLSEMPEDPNNAEANKKFKELQSTIFKKIQTLESETADEALCQCLENSKDEASDVHITSKFRESLQKTKDIKPHVAQLIEFADTIVCKLAVTYNSLKCSPMETALPLFERMESNLEVMAPR